MARALRLGLVGSGRQGREHLVVASGVSIVAATDAVPEATADLCAAHPQVRGYASLADMVESEQLDGIVVAVPHHVTPEIWPKLLKTGLPLLKEKPLGRSLPEAYALIDAAREAEVSVVTAVQRRSHPSYRALAQHLQNQRIDGVSATLHLGFNPHTPAAGWRGDRAMAGGGALLDSGYHMVDLVQMLVGAIEVVSATLWTPDGPAGPSDIDTDAIVQGRAGSCWVRVESRVGGRRRPSGEGWQKFECIEVNAERGTYRADRTGVWCNGEPVFRCERGWSAGMIRQLEDFAEMIRANAFDAPAVWDQVAAMRVVEQSHMAIRLVSGQKERP